MSKHVITQVGPDEWKYGEWTLTQEPCGRATGIHHCGNPAWVATPPHELDQAGWVSLISRLDRVSSVKERIVIARHINPDLNQRCGQQNIEDTIDEFTRDVDRLYQKAWAEALAPAQEE